MNSDDRNWKAYPSIDDQRQNPPNHILDRNELGKRQFTWKEVRQHSNKKDRWLVIDNRVYDVTKWLKHPGGQTVLNHYAGQDASVRIQMI
jgi:cytochrome b involved in lipid metabolism